MSEKRSSPLNNPPSEKRAVAIAPSLKPLTTGSNISDKREKGVSKGGKGRVQPAEAILKCQMCGREQKVVFRLGTPPEWHKCIWCNELQPTDGYRVIAYGSGLPQPLAPHEVEQRKRGQALYGEYNPHGAAFE